ncbi:MAG: PQQ-like beta-propeller repeat protein [Fuerstiella sp.]|nr:PQQ-like beta-propeller repeat protein [Fuerstiella sp.]
MRHPITSVLIFLASSAVADDWPQWGGPQRDAVWRETGIVDSLPETEILPRMWSVPVAEGYSGPAVADGRVFLTDRQANERNERILCLDAKDGTEIWQHSHAARYSVSYPAGPRATPVIDDGRVFTIGAVGHMFCFSAVSGKILWAKNFSEDFGTAMPVWGLAAAPLVDGDHLITLAGGADGALVVCLDKATGEEVWRALDDPAVGYCPPMIFEFGGRRQLIIWHPTAVTALDPNNGSVIWEIPWEIQAGLCIPAPRKIGEQLFLTAFYNGPLMLNVSANTAVVAWKGTSDSELETDGLHSIMPTPWVDQQNIFGICSYGQLRCLETQTGKRRWESRQATGSGRWWNAFIIRHQDRFFIHNEQGDLIIAHLSTDGYKEVSRSQLVAPTRKVQRRMTVWSHPAFALKSVFARNDQELVRVDLSDPDAVDAQ